MYRLSVKKNSVSYIQCTNCSHFFRTKDSNNVKFRNRYVEGERKKSKFELNEGLRKGSLRKNHSNFLFFSKNLSVGK